MVQTTTTPEISLTPGLTYQQSEAHWHRFVLRDMSRETVGAAVNKTYETDAAAHAVGRHVRYLYIIHGPAFTTYLLRRAIQLANDTPGDLRESIAVVGDHVVLTLIRNLVFRRTPSRSRQAVGFFIQEAEATCWLRERTELLGT